MQQGKERKLDKKKKKTDEKLGKGINKVKRQEINKRTEGKKEYKEHKEEDGGLPALMCFKTNKQTRLKQCVHYTFNLKKKILKLLTCNRAGHVTQYDTMTE